MSERLVVDHEERLLTSFVIVDEISIAGEEKLYTRVTTPNAVAVVVTIKETGEYVLVRQPRPAVGKVLWEIPAGKVEAEESESQAAVREVEEETGFVVHELRFLRSFYTSPGTYTERIYLFHAKVSLEDHGFQNLDQDENIRVGYFCPEQLAQLSIVDAKTLIGLWPELARSLLPNCPKS